MQDFLDSTKELESPQSYFYWAILTTISSVISKKMWVDRGALYKLYPNIYTFLISKQSGLRKGVPVDIAKTIAYEVGRVRVITGQNSIQGVIKELAKVRTVGNGHIIKNAEGFLITGEFASFLLQDGTSSSLTTLTDLYDTQYHEKGFKKTLASQDEIELKGLCLTALFASNEVHFFDAVPRNAIAGGFLARTFCIYEKEENTRNSLTGYRKKVPPKIDFLRIIGHIADIAKMEGQIIVEPEANKAYDEWYYDFMDKNHRRDDETGTSERIGDSIWKAAALIGLANNNQPLITEKNMDEAIYQSMITFSNVKRLLMGGAVDAKNIKSIVMRMTVAMILETEPTFEIDRKRILRKGAGVFGVYDLDECIEHLLQAGMVKREKRGSNEYYKLTQIALRRHLENKNGANGLHNDHLDNERDDPEED